jgi:3-dehydrosphinganine reductase
MWQGKKIVITGGSSGIGECMAHKLYKKGADLALVARDMGKLEKTRRSLVEDEKSRVEVYSCDIGSEEKVNETVKNIIDDFGGADILVNCAGILSGGYIEELPIENYRSTMETNFFGLLIMTKTLLPHLKKSKSPRIINIASVAGVLGAFGYSSYCSSKFAVVGFTDALRAEMKPQGIKVHLALPPETDTPMLREVKGRPPELEALVGLLSILSVEKTVDDIIKGVEKGKYLIVPGLLTRFMMRMDQISPAIGKLTNDLTIKRAYKGPKNKRNF